MSGQTVFFMNKSGKHAAKRLKKVAAIIYKQQHDSKSLKQLRQKIPRIPSSLTSPLLRMRKFDCSYQELLSSSLLMSSLHGHFNPAMLQRGFKSSSSPEANGHGELDRAVERTMRMYNLDNNNKHAVRVGFLEGFTERLHTNKPRSIGKTIFFVGLGTLLTYTVYKSIKDKLGESPNKGRFQPQEEGQSSKIRFKDVCGVDEAKEELKDVVTYLKDPEKFTSLGAKLPKGILLVGPPGTGKTLLAKAVAGEAGVPFFYAAGSEFEEMYVGVGASRVRQLFESARAQAPAIIFIDEIDACGSARTNNTLQPYARQTINQLLQEMDGFMKSGEPVIVLGATNSPEVLDKALTRPGRFDSQVQVSLPDIAGRKATLQMYLDKLNGLQSLEKLDLDRMASLTGGFSGADLSNVVNQAALQAAKNNHLLVKQEDLEYAYDKIKMGPELRSRVRSESELKNTAYHEAGHALVALYTPASWDIYKCTIRQRGQALGHVSQLPPLESENGQTKEELIASMNVAMGGRVAEELLHGEERVTTGASSDIQQATNIAYHLVCDLGMSDKLGMMKYDMKKVSEDTKRMVEVEVKRFLQKSYNEAKKLLTSKQSEHKLLSEGLIRYETLTMQEIKILVKTKDMESVQKHRDKNVRKTLDFTTNFKLGPFGVPLIDYTPPKDEDNDVLPKKPTKPTIKPPKNPE